jgi:hypothetical protein
MYLEVFASFTLVHLLIHLEQHIVEVVVHSWFQPLGFDLEASVALQYLEVLVSLLEPQIIVYALDQLLLLVKAFLASLLRKLTTT